MRSQFLNNQYTLDMKKLFSLLLISYVTGLTVYSQSKSNTIKTEIIQSNVSNSQSVFLGKTKPVRQFKKLIDKDVELGDPTSKEQHGAFKNRRGKSNAILPELEHQGPDPLLALNNRLENVQSLPRRPLVNIDGQQFGRAPHDPTGDVGLEYYVQAINVTSVGVYSKNGGLVHAFAMEDFWADLDRESGGDPIVLYDEREDRWIMAEFPRGNAVLIAVSETSDPLGAYFAYQFNTPFFPDYPKYGIWPEHLVLTTNEGSPAQLSEYFLDKKSLYAGDSLVTIQRVEIEGEIFTEFGFLTATPIDVDGLVDPTDTRPMIMRLNDASWGNVAEDVLDIYRFDVDLENPDATIVELIRMKTTPYDAYPCSEAGQGFACIAQPDSALGIDGLPETIMNVPKYRSFDTHESIVLCFITDVTNGDDLSGIRWMELRKTASSDWSIYQEGTYAPSDSINRFMPSIAMDAHGNIGLGYDVASRDVYAGIRYTGRTADAPLGTMNIEEFHVVNGQGVVNSRTRYGDYSQMSVDPVDGRTFWYTSEYASKNVVKSRIVSFKILQDTVDLGVTSFVNPAALGDYGTAETVTINIENFGSQAATGFEIGFMLNGTPIDQQSISDTILPNSSLNFTFSETIDLSETIDYELEAFVHLADDANTINDTLNRTIQNRYQRDIALMFVESAQLACDTSAFLDVLIINKGVDTINKVEILLAIDNNVSDTIVWNGELVNGDTARASIKTAIPANDTMYLATMSVFEVNDSDDLNKQNDSTQLALTKNSAEYTPLVLSIQLDRFPQETSWQIVADSGSVRDSTIEGGPYNGQAFELVEHNICVFSEDCHTFNIFDESQAFITQGICCNFGDGSYKLMRSDGYLFFDKPGDFGSQASESFCPKDTTCSANALPLVQNDSLRLYQIEVVALSGSAPFSYSVDGGLTFQDSSTFSDLTQGEYVYSIRDLNGCIFTDTLIIKDLDVVLESDSVISTCTENVIIPVNVINQGLLNLNEVEIAVDINDLNIDVVTAELPAVAGLVEIEVNLPSLQDDVIQFRLLKVRGATVAASDTAISSVSNDTTLERIVLTIATDRFPDEITWALFPKNDTVPLFEGGPYFGLAFSEIAEEMCLAEDCYTFEIFDAFGDGICCGGENGYQIMDDNDFVYIASDGQYEFGERTDFCVPSDTSCDIQGTAIAFESAPREWNISFTPSYGLAPFQYSIDGGATFQEEALFEGLAGGTYITVIEDARGCRAYLDTLVIDFPLITNTNDADGIDESIFVIVPNPSQGYFDVSFKHSAIDQPQVKIQVMNAQGKLIYEAMMSPYDGLYRAPVSLSNTPKGMYHVRVTAGEVSFSKRVIKN